MSICVIFNPHAGRRRAQQQLRCIQQRYGDIAEFRPTTSTGHAEQLARTAAEEGFDIVAAAGGDGTVHEVANGLLRSGRDTTLAVIPIGSANDFAFSIRKQFGESDLQAGPAHPVDVGLVSATAGPSRFFLEALGLGLAGRVTMESRSIQGLRGVALYGLASWRALRNVSLEDWEIQWDDEHPERCQSLMLSLLLGQREGDFLLAPRALLDDGLFDVVHALRIGRWAALSMLPRLALFGPPQNHPQVRLRRCHRMSLRSQGPIVAHADGELLCTPTDDVRELQVELLPRRLKAMVVRVS